MCFTCKITCAVTYIGRKNVMCFTCHFTSFHMSFHMAHVTFHMSLSHVILHVKAHVMSLTSPSCITQTLSFYYKLYRCIILVEDSLGTLLTSNAKTKTHFYLVAERLSHCTPFPRGIKNKESRKIDPPLHSVAAREARAKRATTALWGGFPNIGENKNSRKLLYLNDWSDPEQRTYFFSGKYQKISTLNTSLIFSRKFFPWSFFSKSPEAEAN